MMKLIAYLSLPAALLLTMATSTSALAQTPAQAPISAFGSGGSGFGVGAAAFLSGVTGVEAVYDQPKWHAEGLFGFSSLKPAAGPNPPTTTTFHFGVRGWYHVHTGVSSDFSLGGGLGFASFSTSNNGPSGTTTSVEPGIQARVFLTPNFDLHATAGLSLTFGGNANPGGTTGVSLTEQFLGDLGFTYFFR